MKKVQRFLIIAAVFATGLWFIAKMYSWVSDDVSEFHSSASEAFEQAVDAPSLSARTESPVPDNAMRRVVSPTVVEVTGDMERVAVPSPSRKSTEPGPLPEDWTDLDAGQPPPEVAVKPPWISDESTPVPPSPTDGTVREQAQMILDAAGPQASILAWDLLTSEQPGLGLVGVAVLSGLPGWDDETTRVIASHSDVSVPLYAMQAMLENGQRQDAQFLRESLLQRFSSGDIDWHELAATNTLPGTAVRGLLDVAREVATEEQRGELAAALIGDPFLDYGARMRALLEFEALLPFQSFREIVRDERALAADADDHLWSTGLDRLMERLEGPEEVIPGLGVLSVVDIDLLTAREYPSMLEDLALRLEHMLSMEDARYGHGVSDRLRAFIEQVRQEPLASEESLAVNRLEAALGRIVESDVARWSPPAPPR